ncbi:MAG: ATP-binding protein [Microscillaceae bacterium]|jgi:hypothetical protein|nr:ATP-binding protein [Microscillaceae bacterium]
MINNEYFKIDSGLKDIIGQKLITDDVVAIFELVKNSFDAYAQNVLIVFNNLYNQTEQPEIIIIDDGKGMSIEDIRKKWLRVAYSAKRDGTEDIDTEGGREVDYRNLIQQKRYYAGAKGVGRFSCDRLGSYLEMITVKNQPNALVEKVVVHWDKFEVNNKEFIEIPIAHETLSNNPLPFKSGTMLIIRNLRAKWDKSLLIRLKRTLEKLINPNQSNVNEKFSISIQISDLINNDDKKERQEIEKEVVGAVKNEIFETLGIKTTQILVEIDEKGEEIITTLTDRGKRIYTVKEFNFSFEKLKNLKFHLFQLNRAAKHNFTLTQGISPVEYGNVFIYKNGFRIYPYGERNKDLLGIDIRKVQGRNRYFGTRDLIGRIEIFGENTDLEEKSSRDGGLDRNETYDQLRRFFFTRVVSRLETYVVEIIKWGDPIIDKQTGELIEPEKNPDDVKRQITELITKLIKSDEVFDIDYDSKFLDIISYVQQNSITEVIKNLKRIADKSDNKSLTEDTQLLEKHFFLIKNEVEEAEKRAKIEKQRRKEENKKRKEAEQKAIKEQRKREEEEKKRKVAEQKVIDEQKKREEAEKEALNKNQEIKYIIGQNLFLKSAVNKDTQQAQGLLHHINFSTERIRKHIDNLLKNIDQNNSLKSLKIISIENTKISTLAKYYNKANFDTKVSVIKNDIVAFINEYLENVYNLDKELKDNNDWIPIEIITPSKLTFKIPFNPLEITIVLDNLLNNSRKAKAKKVIFEWLFISDNQVQLSVKDDGVGVPQQFLNNIFDFGFTTTNGSGLGLFHSKEIMNKLGNIELNKDFSVGANFVLTFNQSK